MAMQNALRRLDAAGIEGDVVECGVWRGGHIILARLVSPQRHCWLFDTFEGMTKPGPHDTKRDGSTAQQVLDRKTIAMSFAPLDLVEDCLRTEGVLDHSKLTFVKGPVEETLTRPENLPDKIALLRLDTDWHDSTKIELEVLWPRLVKGGTLIIDDYGHWMGARKAVDDYFKRVLPSYRRKLCPIDYTAVTMTRY